MLIIAHYINIPIHFYILTYVYLHNFIGNFMQFRLNLSNGLFNSFLNLPI